MSGNKQEERSLKEKAFNDVMFCLPFSFAFLISDDKITDKSPELNECKLQHTI